MSGHSHWSSIKHKKGAMDAKRGKIFSKLSRLISVAAREKGGDPNSNPKLRIAIEKARQANMPNDNIQRAVKKGTGDMEGAKIESVLYEAYGPAGVALIIEGITDNKNRTLSEIKHTLSRFGGKMAQVGSVKYMFDYQNGQWSAKYPFEIADEKSRKQINNLFEALNDNDDVQEIYSNLK